MTSSEKWKKFRETGLLLFVNQFLHIFGWSIAYSLDENGRIVGVYPERVKYRGFSHESQANAYLKISNWLKDNVGEVNSEINEEK